MKPVVISMRGFAEVSAAKADRKQSKLKRFKHRDSEESVGRSNYYVRAIAAIKRHHKGEANVVDAILQELLEEAASESDQRKKAKFLNNHRAIVDYLKHFGKRALVIKPGARLRYIYENLTVNAHPDLVAEENGQTVLIKLNCCKDDFNGGVTSTLLHVMYESAKSKAIDIKPTDVECLQISSGSRITGPKVGFPSKSVLNTQCKELLALWPAA